jgi:hypothetical protein
MNDASAMEIRVWVTIAGRGWACDRPLSPAPTARGATKVGRRNQTAVYRRDA